MTSIPTAAISGQNPKTRSNSHTRRIWTATIDNVQSPIKFAVVDYLIRLSKIIEISNLVSPHPGSIRKE
jgi:hypothetical protein